MADAKSDELWLTARAAASALSDRDLMRQVAATNVLSAALRQEIAARTQARRLSEGDVGEQRRKIQSWLDSLPSA